MMRRRQQRGATLIEYALLITLLVVPLVEVSGRVRDSQGDTITENGNRAGIPDEYSGGVDPSSAGPVFDSGDQGTGSTGIETFAALSASGKKKGNKWTAVVAIDASDASGSVSGGVFDGTWEVFDLDGTLNRTFSSTCTIDTKGTCTLSLAQLNFGTAEVDHTATFTITGLTSEDLVPGPGVVGSTISIEKTTL